MPENLEDSTFNAAGASASGGSTGSSQQDFEWTLYQATRDKYGPLLKEFASDDDLIEQTFKNVNIAVEGRTIPVIKPPTASDAISNASDHVLTSPRITVPPRPVNENYDDARVVSERVQQFLSFWWDNAFTYCGDPLGRGKVQLVKGKLVLKKTLNWDALPDLPDKPTAADRKRYRAALVRAGRSGFLWNLEVIPKETVFEDIEHPWNPDYVFEAYDITVYSALKKFPKLKGTGKLNANDPLGTVEYVEYWEKPTADSEGQFIQWVAGERVHADVNPYCWEDAGGFCGYVPYVIGDPGWGDEKATAKPEDRYISIIRRARSILEAEAMMLTTMNEYLKFYVFKPLKTKNIPPGKELANIPGATWDLQEGQEADFLQPGDMPTGLLAGLQRVLGYADQTSKFSTLGGMAQRGVDTATEADQNSRNAATKLSGIIRAMRRMVIMLNGQIEMDVEHVLFAPVTLYGALGYGPSEVTLKPTDIGGFYLTHVEMETSDEAALNLSNARTWSDLAQRMPISFKTVMRMAGIMNGTQEMDERTVEDLERSPQVQQALLAILLQGMGAPTAPAGPVPGTPMTDTPEEPNAPTPESIAEQARAQAQTQQPDRAYR